MSTPSEQTDSPDDVAPDEVAATIADAADASPAEPSVEQPASRTRTHVRDLTRWHIPFHYLPTVIVTAVGIAMLAAGGTAGWFGGWWLAAALPIAIGAFLRSLWFAAIPLVVWGGWLVYVDGAAETATLANTPPLLGICLGLIGVGATVVAQRAVFPATEPGAWEASVGRLVPPLDDGETGELEEHSGDHTIEFAVVEPIEASEEELEAAAVAALSEATIAQVPVEVDAAPVEVDDANDDADEVDEADAEDEDEDAVDAEAAEADGAVAEFEAVQLDDAEAETEVSADDAQVAADTEADDADADDTGAAPSDAAGDDEAGEPDDEADAVAPATEIVALPLDADPSALDEGGHPMEFRAITEEDLALADEAAPDDAADADESESLDADAVPAGSNPPLPAATQAGRRRRKRS